MARYVLVTGGAGYIGSHACKVLYENEYLPVVFDNLSTGHLDFVKWGPFFRGDLLNQLDLKEVFRQYEFSAVMHFAAKAYVSESVNNPIKYYRENVQGSINLLEEFVAHKVKNFIFSSSCATYGNPKNNLINEDTRQEPINPYGFTKLAIEKLIFDLGKLHNFNFTILRYFNAAGADRDLEIGERHADETHVIPLLIRAATSAGTFKIFGQDFDTPDGTAVRDYVHVSDIAFAHLRALEVMSEENRNIVCNLGTGSGVSVLELVEQLRKYKKNFRVQNVERRPGDPGVLVAENKMSKDTLQVDYKNSNLESILRSAISWHESELQA